MREFPQVSRHLPWRSREFPQVSRHLPWRLRESRKSLGIYRGVCGSSRKSLGIYRGVCASCASLAAFAGACLRTRVGAYCIRPTKRPGTGRMIISGVHPFGPTGPFDVGLLGAAPRWFVGAGTRVGGATAYALPGATIGGEYTSPGYGHSAPFGSVWRAYAIRPYRGTCIRVPSGTRPASPASADARPYRGTCIRVPSGTRPNSPASADAPGQLPCLGRGRSDRNKCTSSSCFCLRILVRLRGQRSIRKTCVSIRNITYFISPVHMAGMFILQAPYLLPISAVCFPRCSRNPRAVNNPSRRN